MKRATAGKAMKFCNKKKWRIEWIIELELKVCNLLCMKFITNKKMRIHISHCVSPWVPGSQIKHSMRLVPVSSFQVILNHQQNWDRHSVKLGKPNVTCDIGMKWDKLLKSLGVVWKNFTQGRSLKPWDFRKIPRHSGSPEGKFYRQPQGFSTVCQTLVS